MSNGKFAVILAGGQGRRMGTSTPKQFLEICGKPILRHTVERFLEYDPEIGIVIAIPSAHRDFWKSYCSRTGFLERYVLCQGGLTRFHSVQNALAGIPDGALVAVHDGVRPFITPDFIGSLFDRAEEEGTAVPVAGLTDSLRRLLPEGGSIAEDRSSYVTVQTPQVFRSELIKKAYSQPYRPEFTDDASVVEAYGQKISLCRGSRENIKITTPDDITIAKAILSHPLRENP